MYYKVIKNRQVIDVLDKLLFVRYQLKHKVLLLCDEEDAEGILSSDGQYAYHLSTLNKFPTDEFDTVTLMEISKTEYERLKALCLKTPEQIAEAVLMELMERGAI